MKTLRLILGDQLNHDHSWFADAQKNITYVIMEMRQETDYATHHIQKVVAFFAAMTSFAEQLQADGHKVIHWTLDTPENQQDLVKNLSWLIAEHDVERFEYLLPDEFRLDEQLSTFCESLEIASAAFDTEHFMSERHELAAFFEGKKTYLMESFYRDIRRRFDIMMEGDQPVTGQWNYDAENRKKLPKKHVPVDPLLFEKEVSDILERIERHGVKTMGDIKPERFIWPTTRSEGLELLAFFNEHCLPNFGNFQDAMTPNYWSLYHSRLSFVMNVKLLSPLEVVEASVAHWEANPDTISISQIEGFVRQIIGWREYMRGVYWAKMPDYASLNFFGHDRKLPDWFWTGETKMACLSHAIGQSLEHAYAHHIQRLMVTGNFALLAGIHPDEVDAWYLGIYIDAIEWVEITNTRGMSQFADGGIVGTKPYVASANYMHKMGHYCSGCAYKKSEKLGDDACPFNSLYWHFYDRHEDKLARNPRIGMAYRLWAKMDADKREAILAQAERHLENLDTL